MRTLVLIAAILTFAVPSSFAQPNSRSRKGIPTGDWSLSFGPSQTRGKIVDLFSITSDATKGLAVNDVSLENRSNQDVAAVKIGWKLYEKSDPSKTLIDGETPQFVGVALAPGEKRVVSFPVVSFAKIHRPLLKNGKLEGNFRIELWVTEVQFDNGNLQRGS